jgi:glycosyltransferase involved in cell wall biosynthesis
MDVRALWLTETYPPDRGGMAWSCDRIVRNLRRSGVLVDVACFGRAVAPAAEWTTEVREGGVELRGPASGDAGHATAVLWNEVQRRHQAAPYTHVVAFGGLLPLVAAPPFAAWLDVPLVTLVRGNDFDTGLFVPGRGALVREALAGAAAIGAVTTEQVKKIRALYPRLPERQVVWTPNGIDCSRWRLLPEDRARGAAWRRANVQASRRVLGFFGQLKRKKGAAFFLEALAESGVAERFHLLFVGDLEEDVQTWLTARQPPIAHSVLPFRDRYELLPLYAAADLVVVPSFYDGLPNVLLEAAALGIAPLASDAGGMTDVVGAASALLFAKGDRRACRRAVVRAAQVDDEELGRLGAAAQAVVAERFQERQETERYRALLDEASRAHERGSSHP